MSELMLVNPRRKRRRKMSALQKQYFGKNPSRRRRRRRTRTALAVNPRRPRRHTTLRSNPVRRHRRRRSRMSFRRNPVRFNARSMINDMLIPAGVGAAGALGVDLALGYGSPYLPTMLQSGIGNTITRIAGAIGVGYVAGMLAGKRFGEQATAGAVTVTLYDLIKGFVKSSVPGLPLSGYNMGWISPGMQTGPFGMYVGSDNAYKGVSGMGVYVSEDESSYYPSYAQ